MNKCFLFILAPMLCFLLATCTSEDGVTKAAPSVDVPTLETEAIREGTDTGKGQSGLGTVTAGTEKYRDFLIDNVFHSVSEGDIHYNVYIPETYDGTKPYALYFTLPGYGGLYFQGAAANIKTEEFGFEAMKYNEEMIIVASQLNDWGDTSANQTIALVEYFLEQYNIDRDQVYGSGYSGPGGGRNHVARNGKKAGFIYRISSYQFKVGWRVCAGSRAETPSLFGHRQK